MCVYQKKWPEIGSPLRINGKPPVSPKLGFSSNKKRISNPSHNCGHTQDEKESIFGWTSACWDPQFHRPSRPSRNPQRAGRRTLKKWPVTPAPGLCLCYVYSNHVLDTKDERFSPVMIHEDVPSMPLSSICDAKNGSRWGAWKNRGTRNLAILSTFWCHQTGQLKTFQKNGCFHGKMFYEWEIFSTRLLAAVFFESWSLGPRSAYKKVKCQSRSQKLWSRWIFGVSQ